MSENVEKEVWQTIMDVIFGYNKYYLIAFLPNLYDMATFIVYMVNPNGTFTDWTSAWPWFATIFFVIGLIEDLELVSDLILSATEIVDIAMAD